MALRGREGRVEQGWGGGEGSREGGGGGEREVRAAERVRGILVFSGSMGAGVREMTEGVLLVRMGEGK